VAVNPEYKALAIAVDVTDASSVAQMVSTAVSTFRRIDYLVNSAGIGVKEHRSVEEVSPGDMERFWKVNIMGTVHCTQAVARVMQRQSVATFQSPGRGSSREVGRGVIVNLGSANSYMATLEVAPYVTTKHAVIGLTKNSGMIHHRHLKQRPIILIVVCSARSRKVSNSGERDLPRVDANADGRGGPEWEPEPGWDDEVGCTDEAHCVSRGDCGYCCVYDEPKIELCHGGWLDC
jgi:NAD(P)-dependent dehydrogenase (short-subunit alcohol dehydrogenase family)